MSTPGQKIIKGLQEATCGDFAAVTIDGQRWVRSDAFEAMVEALEGLVKCCEEHDAAIASVMGKPPGWKDAYLDTARAALASVKGEQA